MNIYLKSRTVNAYCFKKKNPLIWQQIEKEMFYLFTIIKLEALKGLGNGESQKKVTLTSTENFQNH